MRLSHDHRTGISSPDRELAEIDFLLEAIRERIGKFIKTPPALQETALTLRQIIKRRRLRDECFARGLFADPAWDILLELMASHMEGKRVSVSMACAAAAVPSTTALRWVDILVARDFATRVPDPRDKRRIYIELSERGLNAMFAYLDRTRIVGNPGRTADSAERVRGVGTG